LQLSVAVLHTPPEHSESRWHGPPDGSLAAHVSSFQLHVFDAHSESRSHAVPSVPAAAHMFVFQLQMPPAHSESRSHGAPIAPGFAHVWVFQLQRPVPHSTSREQGPPPGSPLLPLDEDDDEEDDDDDEDPPPSFPGATPVPVPCGSDGSVDVHGVQCCAVGSPQESEPMLPVEEPPHARASSDPAQAKKKKRRMGGAWERSAPFMRRGYGPAHETLPGCARPCDRTRAARACAWDTSR
jgi:hypothetical protein